MLITKLEIAKNKSKIKVFMDGEFYTELDEYLVENNNIAENTYIDDNFFNQIMLESELKYAKEKLFNYLTKCMKTVKECVKYLKDKKFNNLIIYKTITIAEEYKILDDERYAQLFIDLNKEKKSINYIKYSLIEKGIDKKFIDDLILDSEIYEENTAYNESLKYIKNKVLNKKTTEKLIRYLYSKGFGWDCINNVLTKLKIESENE